MKYSPRFEIKLGFCKAYGYTKEELKFFLSQLPFEPLYKYIDFYDLTVIEREEVDEDKLTDDEYEEYPEDFNMLSYDELLDKLEEY